MTTIQDITTTAAILAARHSWEAVPAQAMKLAEALLPLTVPAQVLVGQAPVQMAVWYVPETKVAYVDVPRGLDTAQGVTKFAKELEAALHLAEPPVFLVVGGAPSSRDPLAVRIASSCPGAMPPKVADALEPVLGYIASTGLLEASEPLSKMAASMHGFSPTLRGLGEMAGYLPGGQFSWELPGVPRHLQGMLGGGILGGALGYGAGWLGSQVLPDSWDKSKLKRKTMLMGAAAGALPGALAMGAELGTGQRGLADKVFDAPPPYGWPQEAKLGSEILLANEALDIELPPLLKYAASLTGVDEFSVPQSPVPVDMFNTMIWGDPRVSGPLSLQQQAAASGLVNAARLQREQLTGEQTHYVYPSDIARVAAGMGSGYLSGAIVGKVLGEMLGAPPAVQEKLKNTGMWAGIISSVLPIVFSR